MSLRTATDFKLQKWVLQKRENDRSPFNLFECWVFQFNENESPLLLHGEVSAEVIAKYIYIAIGLLKPWTANIVLLILLEQKLWSSIDWSSFMEEYIVELFDLINAVICFWFTFLVVENL
ncbi:hypothetical protein Gotur_023180 [Gossypium turneri]